MLFWRGSYLILQLNSRDNVFIHVYWAGLGSAGFRAFPGDIKKCLEKQLEQHSSVDPRASYLNVKLISYRHP